MKFEILYGGSVVQSLDLGNGSYKIGRAPECEIQLKSSQISKKHALLIIKGDKVAILDTGSANGIFINGVLVRKQRILRGDDVVIADHKLRLVTGPSAESRVPGSFVSDGNLAVQQQAPEPAAPLLEMAPQEKILLLMDQRVLQPFYKVMQMFDWRVILATILGVTLVLSVLLSVIPIFRWGRMIAQREAITRAHTVLAQVVRENYRILTKTSDYARLTVEAAEVEKGILNIIIVEPKNGTLLAPAKLFNTSLTGIYELIALKKISTENLESVELEREDGTFIVGQPIYLYRPDKTLAAVVLASFQLEESLYATWDPLVEAALLSILLSLIAYYLIFKMISYPILKMQEQLDQALKGEEVSVTCEVQSEELDGLARNINFTLSRLKQVAGAGMGAAIQATDHEAEWDSYHKTIQEMAQATSDALLVLDRDKRVKFVGQALEDLIGLRPQYAIGQNISEACRDTSFAGTAIELVDRVVGNFGQVEVSQLEINGISRTVAGVGHKNSLGEVSYVLIAVRLNEA